MKISIVLVLIGWLLHLFLNNRSLRRAEISRLKDNIVSKTENLQDWCVSEIREGNADHALLFETELSAKVTHLELKIQQLNNYIRAELIRPMELVPIREFDISREIPEHEKILEVIELASNLIEGIESSYCDFYYNRSILLTLYREYKAPLLGALLALSLLYLMLITINFIIG